MDLHPHILSHAITSNFLLKSHDHCSYLVGVGCFPISELIISHWASALASSSFFCTKHMKQFSNYHPNSMSMSLKQKVIFLMSKKLHLHSYMHYFFSYQVGMANLLVLALEIVYYLVWYALIVEGVPLEGQLFVEEPALVGELKIKQTNKYMMHNTVNPFITKQVA